MIKRTTIIETITVLNIILFLYTGIAKILDYNLFREILAISPILGWAAKPVALLLPGLELVMVILLVVPRWRLKGLYACLVLMIAFTAYIIAMFIFAKDMPCSCGGLIQELSWKQHLIFNSLFILLNAWAIILFKRAKKEQLGNWLEVKQYGISHG